MRKVLIATLGFEERFCYRAILRHGMREGDKIILLTGDLTDKVERAYEWVDKFIKSSYGDSVEVRLIKLNLNEVLESVKRISELLDSFEGSDVIVNLSGGMRVLVAYTLLACLMRVRRNLVVEIEREDLSGVVSLDHRLLKLVKEGVKEEHLSLLELVRRGLGDVRSLARELGKDESTVRRYVSDLEELGLIRVKRRKPLAFEPSELSDLFSTSEGLT
ncbi:MAG: CRISPR-associated CARF protein Csa3 [Candidatus Korarchaeum sp.]